MTDGHKPCSVEEKDLLLRDGSILIDVKITVHLPVGVEGRLKHYWTMRIIAQS